MRAGEATEKKREGEGTGVKEEEEDNWFHNGAILAFPSEPYWVTTA